MMPAAILPGFPHWGRPNVIVINPKVAATDLKSLIALAKSKPGSLDYASQGNGPTGT